VKSKPHKSCSHGCLYCYNEPGTEPGPVLKDDFLGRLEKDLPKLKEVIKPGERLSLTFVGDIFDPKLPDGVARKCIELCKRFEIPFQTLTKNGPIAIKHLDLYGENDLFGVTLTCCNDSDSLKWEPGASLWSDRIEALKEAHKRGIKTWVSFEPVVDPKQTLHLIELVAPFADKIKVGKMNSKNNQPWHSDEIKKISQETDWAAFAEDAVKLLKSLGNEFYIKDDLRKFLKEEIPEEKEECGKSGIGSIHSMLKSLKQFCIRAGKQPYIKDGNLQTYKPSGWSGEKNNWLTFDEAVKAFESGAKVSHDGKYQAVDGIGFLVSRPKDEGPQALGGDLDCCRDPETGEISQWATAFLNKVRPFYTEVSLSNCGIRFFCFGNLPGKRNSIFGHGPQNDLPDDSRKRIFEAKPDAKKKADKGDDVFNGLEWYESGRHLTLTGNKLDKFCFELENQSKTIALISQMFLLDETLGEVSTNTKKYRTSGSTKLPELDILKVINTSGFTENGRQLIGAHPIEGSTTGHNLIVDPSRGVWAYMHNFRGGTAPGGDAWIWLACESGAISWDQAGAGSLRDAKVLSETLKYAAANGFISAEEIQKRKAPFIRHVTLEHENGYTGIADDGTIKEVVIDKKDSSKKSLSWISDCAVHIITETIASDCTEFCFHGIGAKDKREVKFTMPADAMAEPKKFKAALINAFGARNQVGSLNFETVQKISLNPMRKQRIEIPTWDKNIPLLPGVGLGEDLEFRLSPMTPADVYDGDIELAKHTLREFLSIHKYAPILLATILGAPAIARWHPDDRFGLALWGLTGSMKTSVVQVALAMFGIGYLDDAAILKHGRGGSTYVGTLEVFAAAGIMCQILDNVKTVDEKDNLQYISIIHSIMEGRDKQRGKKDGGLRDSRIFKCTPIITGEIRPSEASTTARVLNLTWTRPDDGKLTVIQERAAYLPVIGYHWLKYLAGTELNLLEGFNEARTRKMAEFATKQYTNPGRLAAIYTMLRSVWGLLCYSPFGDVFKEFTDEFVIALNEVTDAQGQSVTEETEVARFISGITAIISTQPHLIQEHEYQKPDEYGKSIYKDVIGRWIEDDLFLVPAPTLAALKRLGIFTQIPSEGSMTDALWQAGYLIGEKKPQHRINGKRPRGWVVRGTVIDPQEVQTTI
jgi:DNA repair photolyase